VTLYLAALIERFFLYLWYGNTRLAIVLLPLSWLYQYLAARRHKRSINTHSPLPVPVIIVGNITVGGTGKTPVVIALAKALSAHGHTVGIIARGYGGRAPEYPFALDATTPAHHSGDEPLLLARETQCPVVVGQDRYAAAAALLADHPNCSVIISDDGLQHYRLPRAIEIAVIDGKRGMGNGYCLPAGPLREPVERLSHVDHIIVNDGPDEGVVKGLTANFTHHSQINVSLQPLQWQHLSDGQCYELLPLPWVSRSQTKTTGHNVRDESGERCVAIAAIGHPQRFFTTLASLGICCEQHSFPDHYRFSQADFTQWSDRVVLMTTKDGVKCDTFTMANTWALKVMIQLPPAWIERVVVQVAAYSQFAHDN